MCNKQRQQQQTTTTAHTYTYIRIYVQRPYLIAPGVCNPQLNHPAVLFRRDCVLLYCRGRENKTFCKEIGSIRLGGRTLFVFNLSLLLL